MSNLMFLFDSLNCITSRQSICASSLFRPPCFLFANLRSLALGYCADIRPVDISWLQVDISPVLQRKVHRFKILASSPCLASDHPLPSLLRYEVVAVFAQSLVSSSRTGPGALPVFSPHPARTSALMLLNFINDFWLFASSWGFALNREIFILHCIPMACRTIHT